MELYYKYFEKEHLLVQKATGEWSTEVYKEYVKVVYQNPLMKGVNKILSDLRELNMKKALDDLDTIFELRNESSNLNYVSVVLINDPIGTVVTHLYQQKVNVGGLKHHYCTTMPQALNLLGLRFTEKEIQTLLKNQELVLHKFTSK